MGINSTILWNKRCSKHVVFMEKEFLLEDSGNKVELREVQNAQTSVDHLIGDEAVIHSSEETVDRSKAQALHRKSRTRTGSREIWISYK